MIRFSYLQLTVNWNCSPDGRGAPPENAARLPSVAEAVQKGRLGEEGRHRMGDHWPGRLNGMSASHKQEGPAQGRSFEPKHLCLQSATNWNALRRRSSAVAEDASFAGSVWRTVMARNESDYHSSRNTSRWFGCAVPMSEKPPRVAVPTRPKFARFCRLKAEFGWP